MFRDAKIGDRVWNFVQGWGNVNRINYDELYPLIIEFENGGLASFTLDGRRFITDINPCLFWDEIKITPPPKPKRKVKKIVEGWARYHITNQDCLMFYKSLTDLQHGLPDSKKHEYFPAVITIEIEE